MHYVFPHNCYYRKAFLIFEDVKEIDLKGEILGTIGIIFELDIKSIEGVITTFIESSLGLYGKIASKRIIVK